MSRLGDAIRAERVARGMSQQHVAGVADISRVYLANIEGGRNTPPPRTVLKIANVFPDVDTADWLWRLLSDTWGQPVADLMQRYARALPDETEAR